MEIITSKQFEYVKRMHRSTKPRLAHKVHFLIVDDRVMITKIIQGLGAHIGPQYENITLQISTDDSCVFMKT